MNVAGLFAGIGGLEIGLARAGHHTSMLCEISPSARAVLESKLDVERRVDDVRQLTSLPEDVDLLVAGFPCQDLSQAGMTAGITGERSSLVGQIFRLLTLRRVQWVVLENVSFMLHLEQGRALRTIVDAFEELGYRWAYRVVNSLGFLPQRRERVIFVATTTDVSPAEVILSDDVSPVLVATDLDRRAHGFYWTEGVRGLGWAADAIPTLKNGSTVGIPSPPAIMLPSGLVVTPDIRDAERLQGFEENWTEPAQTVGRASLRWSLVGNAVSVPVAEWLGRKLTTPGRYDPTRDGSIGKSGKWPRAARFDGAERFAVDIGAYPEWHAREPLHQFLRHPGKPLSERATAGFLSRTERSTLRFPTHFQARLRSHLATMRGSRATSPAWVVAAE